MITKGGFHCKCNTDYYYYETVIRILWSVFLGPKVITLSGFKLYYEIVLISFSILHILNQRRVLATIEIWGSILNWRYQEEYLMDLKSLKEKINKKLIPSSYNSVIKTPLSIFAIFCKIQFLELHSKCKSWKKKIWILIN